jgi:hypothetical protein
MNDISFEDNERTLKEIKSFFFNTLYLWTDNFVFPFVLNYHDFLVFFFFFYLPETPNAFNGILINYIY